MQLPLSPVDLYHYPTVIALIVLQLQTQLLQYICLISLFCSYLISLIYFNGYLWASVLCFLSFVPLCKTGPKDVWSIFKPHRLKSKFSFKKIVNKNLTNL